MKGSAIGLSIYAVMVLGFLGCASEDTMQRASQAEGHYRLGSSYVHTNLQRAIISFEQAIALDPNHRDAHLELGVIYGQQGKLEQAEMHYKHALNIDPDYSEARNNLGTVYARQGRWEEAIREYRRALKNPQYAWPDTAYYNLARVLRETGQIKEALDALNNAKQIVPLAMPATLIHKEFGRIYQKMGDVDKARAAYLEALSADRNEVYHDEIQGYLDQLDGSASDRPGLAEHREPVRGQ